MPASSPAALPLAPPCTADRRATSFDWTMLVLSALLVGGLYLDGWAHLHQRISSSILTPWHALLYASAVGVAICILSQALPRYAAGTPLRDAVPAGYGLSLLGIGGFFIGAAADPLWHLRFGFEVDVEALLSPPHLIIGASTVLVVSGPFRALWRRLPKGPQIEPAALLPLLISLTLTLSLLTFFTEFLHPLVNAWAGSGFMARHPLKQAAPAVGQALGIAGILFQSSLLMGCILLLVQRWRPPFGGLTLLCGLNMALMTVFRDEYRLLPIGILTGLAADGLIRQLRPGRDRRRELRAFAFAVPLVCYGLYFATLALSEGIGWSVHLWMGSWLLAGMSGLLVSLLVVPPADEA
jgi:hypothetical protein